MSDRRPKSSELARLLGDLADERLSDADRTRLLDLLRSDAKARDYYLDYIHLHVTLARGARLCLSRRVRPGAAGHRGRRASRRDCGSAVAGFGPRRPRAGGPRPSPFGPLSLAPVLGGAAFVYAVAALVLAAGAFAAWRWGAVGRPAQVAKGAPGPRANLEQVGLITGAVDCRWADRGTAAGAGPERIAVISGAVDCRWADADTAIEPGAAVLAGRRFALASGLLQIRYESHVEVILQGPAIYEADSPNGGFLSLGRLTARVEKGPNADSREPTAPGAARRFPAPDFTIRTPSAVLANQAAMARPGVLGSSEFGVVVDSPDVTRVHVFRGRVTTRLAGGGPKNAPALPLAASRSRLLARSGARGMTDLGRKLPMGGVLFARRGVVPLDGQGEQVEQVAWLKAVGTGPQRKLVAVGSGEDVELPSLTDPTGGAASRQGPPAPTLLPRPTLGPASCTPAGLGLMSATLTLPRSCSAATTWRTKASPRFGSTARTSPRGHAIPAEADAATREFGGFAIHGGLQPGYFVPGNNVLEIDVNNALSSRRTCCGFGRR